MIKNLLSSQRMSGNVWNYLGMFLGSEIIHNLDFDGFNLSQFISV